jgi:hypothetical protein
MVCRVYHTPNTIQVGLSTNTYAHQGKRVSFHTRIQGRVTPVSWLKLSFLMKIGSHGKAAKMSKMAINTRRYQPSALSQIQRCIKLVIYVMIQKLEFVSSYLTRFFSEIVTLVIYIYMSILFAHDAFLKYPSSGTFKIERLESHIFWRN